MTESPQYSWICSECARKVPNRLDTCRCGNGRDPGTTGAMGATGATVAEGTIVATGAEGATAVEAVPPAHQQLQRLALSSLPDTCLTERKRTTSAHRWRAVECRILRLGQNTVCFRAKETKRAAGYASDPPRRHAHAGKRPRILQRVRDRQRSPTRPTQAW